MGTHIVWRNPSPPRRVEFKLRRVAANQRAIVYQVGPNYRHPFELVRTGAYPAKLTRTKPEAGPIATGAELVQARW